MDSIRIALVQCYSELQPPSSEPLSIEVLAGSLREFTPNEVQYDILILDRRDEEQYVNTRKALCLGSYNIIAVSIPQGNFSVSIALLNEIYNVHYNGVVILGGALPTFNPLSYLKEFPSVLIVRGWGETAFLKIVRSQLKGKEALPTIENLVFSKKGKIVSNPVIWAREKLLPVRKSYIDFFMRLESSRGCQYDICVFCLRYPRCEEGRKWYRLPIQETIEQIRLFSKNGVREFTFTDEDFCGSDLSGAELIASELYNCSSFKFSLSLRADSIWHENYSAKEKKRRYDLLDLLKRSGLSLLYIGVESLSRTQLLRYGKNIRKEVLLKAIEIVQSLSIGLELGFILFDPLMDQSELEENIENLKTHKLYQLVGQLFNTLRVYENTPYKTLLLEQGLLGELNNETLEYSYYYKNDNIGKIVKECIQWKNEIDSIYILARNASRTLKANHRACVDFIFVIHNLEFNLLENLVADTTNIRNTIAKSCLLRHKAVIELSKDMRDYGEVSTDDRLLKKEISKYCEEFNVMV